MSLPDIFEIVRGSIVALVSRAVVTEVGKEPTFPKIIGTGFFVDAMGIVATNRHVVEALSTLPSHPETGHTAAAALVHLSTQSSEPGEQVSVQRLVDVRRADAVAEFEAGTTSWYGQKVPDIGFIQLNVQDVPAMRVERLIAELCASWHASGNCGISSWRAGTSDGPEDSSSYSLSPAGYC